MYYTQCILFFAPLHVISLTGPGSMFISPCGKSFSAIDTLISMGKPRLGELGGAPTASDSLIRRTSTSSTTKNSPVSGMSSCKEGGEVRGREGGGVRRRETKTETGKEREYIHAYYIE